MTEPPDIFNNVELISVYNIEDRYGILYRLLSERTAHVNISHEEMPTLKNHMRFVDKIPYDAWYFITNEEKDIVGSIYLTENNEIGVFILKRWQRNGYATKAIKALIQQHGAGKYYANIAPDNEESKDLFTKLGFTLLQCTYKFSA